MGPRLRMCFLFALVVVLAGCVRHDAELTPASRAAVETGVRSFMHSVEHDVASEGPTAWQKEFADDPAFFMAADGQLAFPNWQVARESIQDLPRVIKRMDLNWGNDLRVDPLSPTMAMVATSYHEVRTDPQGHQTTESGFFTAVTQFMNGRWQFRDAHWSTVAPPAKSP